MTKNNKNVTQTTQCDENTENCHTLKREREKERERRETHTERDRESVREEGRDSSASASPMERLAPAPESRQKPLATDSTEIQTEINPVSTQTAETNTSAAESPKNKDGEKETGEISGVISASLESWFMENCFGYESKKARKQISEITNRIINLNCDSAKVTNEILAEFRQMHERDGPWKDIPLSPTMLLKSSVWTYVLNAVGKKLKITKKKTFLDSYKKYQQECEAENKEHEDFLNSEYKKYGINPDDPNKTQKLLAMKSKQKQEEPFPGDIF